jgi:hypothetical protein
MSHSQDPDDLYGDAPIARIEITCRRNGSMSVAGNIDNLTYALAILDNARDAIRSHHGRMQAAKQKPLIVPSMDLAL